MATNKYFQETGGAEDQIATKTQWHKIAVYKPFLVEKVEAYLKASSKENGRPSLPANEVRSLGKSKRKPNE